jgi:heptosyltransferase-2
LGIRKDDRVFGLSPGSALSALKRWYPDRFAQSASVISNTYDAKGIIFGASPDKDLGDRILSEVSNRPIYNLIGETTLEEAIALIALCGLFLSNDSGLMHTAAALDVPLGAIFGPSDPRTTSPWCKRFVLLRRQDLHCSPCMKKEDCPYDHECMRGISVEHVLRVVETLVRDYGFDTLGRRQENLAVSDSAVPVV